MTTKDAIFRELRYGLAGSGGALEGLIDPLRIKMDVRIQPDSEQSDDDYPWLIFRRITSSEDNAVRYARERYEFELIGKISSEDKNDDLLEQIRDALIDHFAGKMKTWGKFTEDGTADPSGGLKMRAMYMDSVDMTEFNSNEKVQILMFTFTHIR